MNGKKIILANTVGNAPDKSSLGNLHCGARGLEVVGRKVVISEREKGRIWEFG